MSQTLRASVMFTTANEFFVGQKSKIKVSLLISTLGKRDCQEISFIRFIFFQQIETSEMLGWSATPHVCVLSSFVLVRPCSGDFYMLSWMISPPIVFGSPHSALFLVLSLCSLECFPLRFQFQIL